MEDIKGYFMCPNCGNMIEDANAQTCSNCTYDFGQLIHCMYLDDDKFCTLTDKPCHVKGMDYETCNIYINKYHLNQSPE